MSLRIKSVTVQEEVPLHAHPPGEKCWGHDMSDTGCTFTFAEYIIDLESEACLGRVLDDGLVVVDAEAWAARCARVGARVRDRLKDRVVLQDGP